ncbi:MAG: glycosyltransferase family 2 protein [Methylomonas sp.]|nr:glycosyltransferase family 2 protein [Methylomonas sp.]PPD20176.1 MAG: glycosyl transferase family 2 [Methylomonas sp.]PPD52393.1 MAG: glycosyl transferase family 2 [Methylomonas sp.]
MTAAISVVIPLHDKAPHIAHTLASVLAQTRPPDEIIVVDDGSTDGGAAVVEEFISQGVCLIRQENQGVSAARNHGAMAAQGSHIAFLDADDEWLPNHIATLYELIESWPQAALFSTAHLIKREGKQYHAKSLFSKGWHGVVDDFFRSYADGLSIVNSSTACVRKSVMMQEGGFPVGIKRGEDIIFWIKMALNYPVAHAAAHTAIYNQEAVNRTVKLRETEPPGSLIFLAQILRSAEVPTQHRLGLGVLFNRIAFFTGAGFRMNGDLAGLNAIRRLALASGEWRVGLALLAITLVPAPLLRLARRLRHRPAALYQHTPRSSTALDG